jgi:hypothetical protein
MRNTLSDKVFYSLIYILFKIFFEHVKMRGRRFRWEVLHKNCFCVDLTTLYQL